jgi:hypothetical protein
VNNGEVLGIPWKQSIPPSEVQIFSAPFSECVFFLRDEIKFDTHKQEEVNLKLTFLQ